MTSHKELLIITALQFGHLDPPPPFVTQSCPCLLCVSMVYCVLKTMHLNLPSLCLMSFVNFQKPRNELHETIKFGPKKMNFYMCVL